MRFVALRFCVFPFFFFHMFSSQAVTVYVRYINSSHNFWPVFCEQCIHTLFMDPQISFFINFFIKNGSYGTIHTFKNYFATVFSVFSFSKISSIQTDPKCKWILSLTNNSPQVAHVAQILATWGYCSCIEKKKRLKRRRKTHCVSAIQTTP